MSSSYLGGLEEDLAWIREQGADDKDRAANGSRASRIESRLRITQRNLDNCAEAGRKLAAEAFKAEREVESLRSAIDEHCMTTECIAPSDGTPRDVIGKIVDWHIGTYADELTALRAERDALRESLAIFVHAHETGNSVPPHIEVVAHQRLNSIEEEQSNIEHYQEAIQNVTKRKEISLSQACAQLLVGSAHKQNAAELTIRLEDVTESDQKIGSWTVHAVQDGFGPPASQQGGVPEWYARREQHARELGFAGVAEALDRLEQLLTATPSTAGAEPIVPANAGRAHNDYLMAPFLARKEGDA